MSSMFGSSPAAGAPTSKNDVIKLVQQEIAQRSMTELIQSMHETCFSKCINQPSSTMSTTETNCMSSCAMKYMGLVDVVSKEWNKSIGQMRSQQDSQRFLG